MARPASAGGRSFGTTLGHFHENFTLPAFRRALVNGILWAARIDVPADGAAVEVATELLQLPAKPAPAKSVPAPGARPTN